MNQSSHVKAQSNKSQLFQRLRPLIIDVGVPIAAYYLLHLLGANDFIALTAGAILPALAVVFRIIKSRTFDQLGIFMSIMFALGILLLFITGNPRLILAKPALFVVVAAIYFLSTLRKRPAMLAIAFPMATEGNKKLEALWEKAWQISAPFQKAIKKSTIGLSLALLVDAIGRVLIVFTMPVSQAVAFSQLPGLLALIIAIRYHLTTVKPIFESIRKQHNL